MRIGLSSIVGDGFGNGSFVFGEVPSGGGFPAAGTYNRTLYGVEYPIANGGASVTIQSEPAVATQICNVDEEHDGSGGFYNDWANATNIQYKSYGTDLVTTNYPSHDGGSFVKWGTTYYTGDILGWISRSDGAGSFFQVDNPTGANTKSGVIGTDYVNSNSTANYYLVDIFGNFAQNGKYTSYTASYFDGSYNYNDNQGSFQPNGTSTGYYEPSMGNPIYWDGNGGYYY